jgi:quinol monooxygenase YgiN
MTAQFLVLARYTFTSPVDDDDRALLTALRDESRREPGNIAFEVFPSIERDDQVLLVERYVDADAFAAHRATPHFGALVLGHIVPRLADRTVETTQIDEATDRKPTKGDARDD